MIDVVSVASEAFPLIKTGGLADVAGALPAAVAAHGIAMRTLIPGYPTVMAALEGGEAAAELGNFFGGPARLVAGRGGGLDLIVIDAPHLFARAGGPYLGPDGRDWPDNWRRFAALSYAGYELARGVVEGYRPQIVHCHDWQAGLVPAYLKFNGHNAAKSVMTVHNVAFQGYFGWDIFNALRLDYEAARSGAIEFHGGVGYLKAGLQSADAITTVSPTYAHEIATPAYGMGLEGLLQARSDVVHGILNGIDADAWNPATDPALARTYDANRLSLRTANRRAVCERFGIGSGEGPLFSVVSRLSWQKGLDLLLPLVDGLVARGGRLCVLGTGDGVIENGFREAAARHPGKVGVIVGYDEQLSHLIQGGADVVMVPSRFEPCGLTQLYGLRYGCVPLVARVGGLTDTVIDANAAAVEAGVATGIVFSPVTEEALAEAIGRAISLFRNEKLWQKMQRRGMRSDVTWDRSARAYADLYRQLSGLRGNGDPDR